MGVSLKKKKIKIDFFFQKKSKSKKKMFFEKFFRRYYGHNQYKNTFIYLGEYLPSKFVFKCIQIYIKNRPFWAVFAFFEVEK
jgi:hypothetical protein